MQGNSGFLYLLVIEWVAKGQNPSLAANVILLSKQRWRLTQIRQQNIVKKAVGGATNTTSNSKH